MSPHFAWLVVGVSFVTLGLVYGVWYSFSVFFVALLEEFGWSRSMGAGAFSVFIIVSGTIGPYVGNMVYSAGPRKVIIFGSILLGGGARPVQHNADRVALLYLLQCRDGLRAWNGRLGTQCGPGTAVVQGEEGIAHGDHLFRNRNRDSGLRSLDPVSHYADRMADGLSSHGCFHSSGGDFDGHYLLEETSQKGFPSR